MSDTGPATAAADDESVDEQSAVEPAESATPKAGPKALVGSPLHLYRHRGRPAFRLVLDDAVAAAPDRPVPRAGQRGLGRHRLRAGRLRRLAGPLHAHAELQPAAARLGVAGADPGRRDRHGG